MTYQPSRATPRRANVTTSHSLDQLSAVIARYNLAPSGVELYYRRHTDQTIAYLLTAPPNNAQGGNNMSSARWAHEIADKPDLAAGLRVYDTPEARARQFLLSRAAPLLGSLGHDLQFLDGLLFLKHTLRSQMGTHCIFGLRWDQLEINDTSFVVHLDRQQRVVMMSCVYHPILLGIEDMPLPWPEIFVGMRKGAPHLPWQTIQIVNVETVLVPGDGKYRRAARIKLSAPDDDYVMIINLKGHVDQLYSVARHASPWRSYLGKVYRRPWAPSAGTTSVEVSAAFGRADDTEEVIFRDLDETGALSGRYAAVIDTVMPAPSDSNRFTAPPLPNSSLFDRQMAYYHVELIQRYFRDLGLTVLDDYSPLNPLVVVLESHASPSGSRYGTNDQRIHVGRIDDDYCYTDARDPHILYHEFVHAVTDALARIGRQNSENPKDRHFRELVQAVALDEGIAMYFACSVAARQGADRPCIYTFEPFKEEEVLKLDCQSYRVLDHVPAVGCPPYDLVKVQQEAAELEPELITQERIYAWGEQWARYLWTLRATLHGDVADTIISHSIFFLTRWSTFDAGLLALVTADRLLFEGSHVDTIFAKAGGVAGWQIQGACCALPKWPKRNTGP